MFCWPHPMLTLTRVFTLQPSEHHEDQNPEHRHLKAYSLLQIWPQKAGKVCKSVWPPCKHLILQKYLKLRPCPCGFLNFTFSAKYWARDEIFEFLPKIGLLTNIFAFPEKNWSYDNVICFSCQKLFIILGRKSGKICVMNFSQNKWKYLSHGHFLVKMQKFRHMTKIWQKKKQNSKTHMDRA